MKRVSLKCMLATLCLASLAGAADLQINIQTTADQKDPDLAVNLDGRSVVVWNSYGQDGSSGGIFASCIDPNGLVGQEFQVNATATGNQAEPAVALDGRGCFLVAWRGPWPESDAEDIVARLFDPNGRPLTEDIHVNTHTAANQGIPRIAACADGRFIVVWESDSSPTVSRLCIRGQLYDQAGNPIGSEIAVSDTSYPDRYPDVAMDSQGRFAVSWLEDRTTDSVRVRLFDALGAPQGPSLKVNSIGLKALAWPSTAMNADGAFVVAWDGDPNKASEDDIHARIYQADGTPLGDEFLVNTTRPGAQVNPRVAVNSRGEFIVVWENSSADPNGGTDVVGQRFRATGERLGNEFRLNVYATGDQGQPDVSLADTGRFVAVWESLGQDGSGSGIFGTTGPQPLSADLNADGTIDFLDYQGLASQWMEAGPGLSGDLMDDEVIDWIDLAAFCNQWLTAGPS